MGEPLTTFFPFRASQRCKGPLSIPEEKVNSGEESSSEQYFQTTVLGSQGSGLEETSRRRWRRANFLSSQPTGNISSPQLAALQ